MTLEAESVKFVGAASVASSMGALSKKKVKSATDDALIVGERLPKNGTCKHYGKSFRWFRFQCCGRLYPCDVCHESLSEPHETAPANRYGLMMTVDYIVCV